MSFDRSTKSYAANAANDLLFAGDNPAGSGQMLCQVSFTGGATGSVQMKAKVGTEHNLVNQGDPITSDALIRMAYCPMVFADVSSFGGTAGGKIVVSIYSN